MVGTGTDELFARTLSSWASGGGGLVLRPILTFVPFSSSFSWEAWPPRHGPVL